MRIKIQQDIKDCGIVILQAFYKSFYNKWISINEFKKYAFYNDSGISITNLELLANQFGISLASYKGDFNALKNSKISKPCIALININGAHHYVIITKQNSKGFYIIDPMEGKKYFENKQMAEVFLNTIILVEKQQRHKPLATLSVFKEILSYFKTPLILVIIISSIIGSILLVLSSFYMKIIFDKVIKNESYALLVQIFLIFAIVLLFKLWNTFHKTYFLKKLNLQIEQKIVKQYSQALVDIDLNYITKITNNDNLRRINLIPSIADFIANFIFTIISEFILFAFGFSMLLLINVQLFWVVTLGNIITIILAYFFQKKVNKNYKKIITTNLEEFSSQLNIVQNVPSLKITTQKKYFMNHFYNKYYQKKQQQYKVFQLDILNNFLLSFISQFIPLLIIFLGTILFIEKKILFGNILVFVTFFGFYLTPLKSFSEIILKVPIFKNDYDHLNFVLKGQLETQNSKTQNLVKINFLSFENFSFSFDNHKKIFNIKKLEINSNLKIVGKNGSGKSTFLKTIALQKYGIGKYLINGIEKDAFSWEQIRNKMIYINSNDFLASGTIFSLITENDPNKIKLFMECFQKFNFEQLFKSINLSILSEIDNNGNNLSSGQRQIISLMKLFTWQYDLIMLDEAFENIDQQTIAFLQKAIFDFQKETLFIEISHNSKFITDGKELNFENL